MKATKKQIAEHQAWLEKHQREAERNLARLKANTIGAQRRSEEAFWSEEAKKNARVLPLKITSTYAPGIGGKKETMKYTGDKMKGIATMHKSSAVPVFSTEEAIDIARMRRG